MGNSEVPDRRVWLLAELGQRVRERRVARGLTRKALAQESGVSTRFLAALESGLGNISVVRLDDLAQALGLPAAELLGHTTLSDAAPRPQVVALLGLRGAGKSTLGAELARRLGRPLFELDQLVEAAAALPLQSLFEIHGERFFRRLERETLARFLALSRPAVLATGGGIVTEAATFALLRRHAITVWLKARPRDHWDRVVAQGDRRPMANRAEAMAELESLLAGREPLYARADLVVDTSELDVSEAARRVVAGLRQRLAVTRTLSPAPG